MPLISIQPERKWSDNWPKEQRDLAHTLVGKALKSGELIRQPCQVCGAPYALAHDEDYYQPLVVEWLCRSHHVQRHLELDPYIEVRRQQSNGRAWQLHQLSLTDTPITHDGETLTITDWARRRRMRPSTLYTQILRMDWPAALALSLRPASPNLVGRISHLVREARECLAELRGKPVTDEIRS